MLAVIDKVGVLFTVMFIVCVAEQFPEPLDTVYCVEILGVTAIDGFVSLVLQV